MAEQRGCVLLITGDADLASEATAAVGPTGARLLVAATIAEAARLASGADVHLALVDMASGGLDGLEACRALKEDPNTIGIPILAIVGPGAKGAKAPTALDHIVKPLDPEALRRKVSLVLKSREPAAPEGDMIGAAATVDMGKVESRIRRIQELGACPYVVTKILSVSKDTNTGARDLAHVVGTDHALTSKLLKIANSAMYGAKGKITQISQAVTRTGFRSVLELAMGISVTEAFTRKGAAKGGLDRPAFWTHSLAVGLVARRLAMFAKRESAEEAFVAGLLHDIGKPLLEECFPTEYRHALDLAAALKMPIRSAEREVFGADHCFFGGLLMKSWGLPAPIVGAVSHHHNLDRMKRLEDVDQRHLVGTIHLADALCKAARLGSGGDLLIEETPDDLLTQYAPALVDIPLLVREVREEVAQNRQFLEMPSVKEEPPGQPLAGKVVEILAGPGHTFTPSAVGVVVAGGDFRMWGSLKAFHDRVAESPSHAAILDTGRSDSNRRALENLGKDLADRTVCFVDAADLRSAMRETPHRAAVFVKPADPAEVVQRLVGGPA